MLRTEQAACFGNALGGQAVEAADADRRASRVRIGPSSSTMRIRSSGEWTCIRLVIGRLCAFDERREQLDPIAERVADEAAAQARNRVVLDDLDLGFPQSLEQRVVVAGVECWVSLACRREPFLDPDVDLLTPTPEPDAAARAELCGLLDLLEPERLAEEPARRRLAAWGRGELDVIDPRQHLPAR